MSQLASLGIAAAGTALLIGLAYRMKLPAGLNFLNPDQTLKLLQLDQAQVTSLAISQDGKTAVYQGQDSRINVAQVMGLHPVIAAVERAKLTRVGAQGLMIEDQGLGRPGRLIRFATSDLPALDRILQDQV